MDFLLKKWRLFILSWVIGFSLISSPAIAFSQSQQFLAQGIEQFQLHHYQAALAYFSEVIDLGGKLESAGYSNRCLTYLQSYQPHQAVFDCQLALELNPNNTEARLNLGLSYYRLGNYQEALQNYQQVIKANPNDYRAYYNKGLVYATLNAYQKALSSYEQALKTHQAPSLSEQGAVYNERGLLKSKLGHFEEGIADLSQAINLDQSNESYYLNRAICYHQQGNFEAAIKDLSRAISLNPQYSEAYLRRGWLNHRLGNQETAIADLSIFLDYADEQSQAYQRVSILIEPLKRFYYQSRQKQIA